MHIHCYCVLPPPARFLPTLTRAPWPCKRSLARCKSSDGLPHRENPLPSVLRPRWLVSSATFPAWLPSLLPCAAGRGRPAGCHCHKPLQYDCLARSLPSPFALIYLPEHDSTALITNSLSSLALQPGWLASYPTRPTDRPTAVAFLPASAITLRLPEINAVSNKRPSPLTCLYG